MGECVKQENVVLLFDDYNTDSQSLHASFQSVGCSYPTIVIEDNGFLPDDVISVYGFFLGDFRKSDLSFRRPRYFNEIKVPEYWEISGTNVNGKIQNLNRERGRIFYAEPLHKRFVRVVDWYDENGTVRYSDHYNKYGDLYARTIFNKKGKRVNKSYFSSENKEVIVENYVTGDIILNVEEEVKIFKTKTDFVKYFFEKKGFHKARIYYNSLSTPFFVSCSFPNEQKRDILFWQEPVGDAIPGNMQMILNGKAARTGKILVQKRRSYDKLISLGADSEIVGKQGFIYPFERENTYNSEVLICTNSDQIEKLEELIDGIPQVHFHIAAITEMSSKLMSIGNSSNVTLYPSAKLNLIDELFKKCDWYLDINHGSEIVSSVQKAFLNNQLIFAFKNTVHDMNYIAEEHIYSPDQVWELISVIQNMIGKKEEVDKKIEMQKKAALAEDKNTFMKNL